MFRRIIFIVLTALLLALDMEGKGGRMVVMDSVAGMPLVRATVIGRDGTVLGFSDKQGGVAKIPAGSYPILIRYLGYDDKLVISADKDTIQMQSIETLLPEVEIKGKKHKLLHLLGYMREYSTMTSYTDTVFLFREKMVDFMIPLDRKVRFKGWTMPRVLSVKTYVRQTDAKGLDSVSDATRHHFSWSDWIGLPPSTWLPRQLTSNPTEGYDFRSFSAHSENWKREDDRVWVEVNILADSVNRRWTPGLNGFFRQHVDFETLKISCVFDNVLSNLVTPLEIEKFTYNIESRGRGRGMFRFNRKDEPFFVTTDAEVYIIDHEYLDEKEARKWKERKTDEDLIDIILPTEAPELPDHIQTLITRVEAIDKDSIRLELKPDHRLWGRSLYPRVSFGKRVLKFLRKRLCI